MVVFTAKARQAYPQDSINELIIWKMYPYVIPVTGVKFKSAFLHGNEQWIFYESFSVFDQIQNLWMD